MNKKENLIISEEVKNALYELKLSLRESTEEINEKKYYLFKLIDLCDNLNIDIKENLKLDKEEFRLLMNSYGHKTNYYYSVTDLLYGDYNQLIRDAETKETWDELNIMIKNALLFNLIDNNEYNIIKELINKVC